LGDASSHRRLARLPVEGSKRVKNQAKLRAEKFLINFY
jgi:hypothetical protein